MEAQSRSSGLVAAVAVVALVGALVSIVDLSSPPTGRTISTRYRYDRNRQLVTRTMPNGRAVRYRYDRAGLITRMSYHRVGAVTGWPYPASRTVRFAYDAAGDRISMTDATGVTRYDYDELGRISSVKSPSGRKVAYEYDAWNRIREMSLSDGWRMEYQYDIFGNMTAVNSAAGVIRYRYEPRRVTRTLPNGIVTVYLQTTDGQLSEIQHLRADGSVIAAYRHDYAPDGRLKSVTETTSLGTRSTEYEYDTSGRLIRAVLPGGSVTTFEYDVMGNRISETGPRGAMSYTYDALGRLIQAGDTKFKYDAGGNVASRQSSVSSKSTYMYDQENRLTQVRSDGNTIRYGYDGDGNRVWRELNGKRTWYVNDLSSGMSQVVAHYADDGAWSHYLLGPSRIGQVDSDGKVKYILEGHLGSTLVVAGKDGEELARYAYAPFGTPSPSDAQTEFMFAGEQWDPEAGLLYLRARYYDPETGRFMQDDPLAGDVFRPVTFNRYLYANSDPINLIDPAGLHAVEPPQVRPTIDLRKFGEALSRGTWIGTGLGESAATHWAERYVETHKLRYAIPGVLASAWTPETWKATAMTLGAGAALARAGPALARAGAKAGTTNEPFHLKILGKWMHYGNDLRRGPHLGFIERSGKSLVHLRPTHINIGGERGVDILWPRLPPLGATVAAALPAAPEAFRNPHPIVESAVESSIHTALDPFGVLSRTTGIFTPPPPPGGGSAPAVGGVYLDQIAKVIGELGTIRGATYDPDGGQVVLLGDKSTTLPPMRPEYLAAAIRAVYAPSKHAPGMTIDPDPRNPRSPTMLVIFFGNTENTRLGWVMFEADRVMKGYSVGADNVTKQPVLSSVPGYQSVTALELGRPGPQSDLWSRFWLVPDPVNARVSPDGRAILFDPVTIRVKTETMRWENGKLVPAGSGIRDEHAETFASHFTGRYDAFARENPVYGELRQVALAVAVSSWMKQQNVPPNWDFVRSFAGEPYSTPKTTPAATHDEVRRSSTERLTSIQTVSSFGGVDMRAVLNASAHSDGSQLQKRVAAAMAAEGSARRPSFQVNLGRERLEAVTLPSPDHREMGSYDRVEVDLSGLDDEMAGQPGIARYYNSFHNERSELGYGWTIALPHLEFETAAEPGKLEYVSVEGDEATRVLAQRFTLGDPLGLGRERFTEQFVDQQLKRIGFKPQRPGSTFQALYPEGERAYRLISTDGGEAVFDTAGRLRALIASGRETHYDYDDSGLLRGLRATGGRRPEKVRFEYDEQRRIQLVSSGDQRARYLYDERGNLVTVEGSQGVTTYRYDDRRLLTEVIENGETMVTNRYDSRGRVANEDAESDAIERRVKTTRDGEIVTLRSGTRTLQQHFNRERQLTRVEDARGYSEEFSYDAGGRMQKVNVTLPTGGRTTLEISPQRDAVTAQDPRGVRTEYRLDKGGQPVDVLVNGKSAAKYSYDARGNVSEVTYGSGEADRFVYDAEGKLVELRRSENGEGPEEVLRFSYEASGKALAIGHAAAGQVMWTRRDDGVTVADGARTVRYSYDEQRRPTRVETSDGARAVYRYASDGPLEAVQVSRGGRTASLRATGPAEIICEAFSGGQTRYALNSNGSLSSVQSPNGSVTTYRYDDGGRLIEVRLPSSVCLDYAYDAKSGLMVEERVQVCR